MTANAIFSIGDKTYRIEEIVETDQEQELNGAWENYSSHPVRNDGRDVRFAFSGRWSKEKLQEVVSKERLDHPDKNIRIACATELNYLWSLEDNSPLRPFYSPSDRMWAATANSEEWEDYCRNGEGIHEEQQGAVVVWTRASTHDIWGRPITQEESMAHYDKVCNIESVPREWPNWAEIPDCLGWITGGCQLRPEKEYIRCLARGTKIDKIIIENMLKQRYPDKQWRELSTREANQHLPSSGKAWIYDNDKGEVRLYDIARGAWSEEDVKEAWIAMMVSTDHATSTTNLARGDGREVYVHVIKSNTAKACIEQILRETQEEADANDREVRIACDTEYKYVWERDHGDYDRWVYKVDANRNIVVGKVGTPDKRCIGIDEWSDTALAVLMVVSHCKELDYWGRPKIQNDCTCPPDPCNSIKGEWQCREGYGYVEWRKSEILSCADYCRIHGYDPQNAAPGKYIANRQDMLALIPQLEAAHPIDGWEWVVPRKEWEHDQKPDCPMWTMENIAEDGLRHYRPTLRMKQQ